ncbi:MAG: flagellar basal-body rod protein FlgF [Gammaproteobacteria bacterium]|nr:flagellar basal-body rod protein FlgF [Gammaproteobacteria bacterium]
MDRMLYIGMTAAQESMYAQGLNNHNLANVNTTGFRADLEQFRSMPVFGPGHPSRAYSMTERPGIDFRQGAMITTGNPMDMAIKGNGWFAVEGPDGSEAYTRAGDFRVDARGFLLTGTGLRVMGNAGPIVIPPAQSMSIGNDGSIRIQPLGQNAATMADVGRIKMVNPGNANMEKGSDGLFRTREGNPADADLNMRVMTGMLESSNVNVVEAMAKMITLQRNFDMQTKVMKAAQDNDQATDTLMRIS